MFEGYPRYAAASVSFPDVHDPAVTEISEMPAVRTRDDMRSMVTRLRMVMEDPRQLLSGAVTDLAIEALAQADWDPASVYVPGLTDVHYPTDL